MQGLWRDAWRLAVGTFTAVPTPPPTRVDPAVAARAAVLAPAVYAPIAAALGLVGWAAAAVLTPMLGAVLIVAGDAWATRGLHRDGLADTADGLGSGRPPQEALQIMRRGDVGPMGVTALILVIAAQVAALTGLLDRPWGWPAGACALACGRGAVVLAARRGVPAARQGGLGAAFAASVRPAVAAWVWIGLTAVLTVAALPGGSWCHGPLAAVLAVAAVGALVAHARRRLGGVSGDVFGAAVEIAVTAALVGLVAGWPA